MKAEWSIPASLDFEEAIEYIAAERPQSAQRLTRITRKAEALLKKFPRIGKPGRVEDTRELSLSGTPYLIVYRITDRTVEILRFLYHGRLWPIPNLGFDDDDVH